MNTEKRKCRRYLVGITGALEYDGAIYECKIHDINICGVTIITDAKMKLYDIFNLNDICFPDKERFNFVCSVRSAHDGMYGCQFTHLTSSDIQRLSKVIYDLCYK